MQQNDHTKLSCIHCTCTWNGAEVLQMYLQLALHLSDEVSEYLTGTVTDVRASSEEIGPADNSRLAQ